MGVIAPCTWKHTGECSSDKSFKQVFFLFEKQFEITIQTRFDDGMSDQVKCAQTGSEDPHRCEWKFNIVVEAKLERKNCAPGENIFS